MCRGPAGKLLGSRTDLQSEGQQAAIGPNSPPPRTLPAAPEPGRDGQVLSRRRGCRRGMAWADVALPENHNAVPGLTPPAHTSHCKDFPSDLEKDRATRTLQAIEPPVQEETSCLWRAETTWQRCACLQASSQPTALPSQLKDTAPSPTALHRECILAQLCSLMETLRASCCATDLQSTPSLAAPHAHTHGCDLDTSPAWSLLPPTTAH